MSDTTFNSFVVKSLSQFKNVELADGEFLARKIEKGTGKESKGVIIPSLTQEQVIEMMDNDIILNEIVSHLQSVQEECCKKRMDGNDLVYVSDFSLEAMVEHLQEQNIKEGRISKERIIQWFSTQVSPKIHARMNELYPELSNDKMVETLKLYQNQFQHLAKREYYFAPEVSTKIQNALNLIDDSSMKEWAAKKLTEMSKNAKEDMMAL